MSSNATSVNVPNSQGLIVTGCYRSGTTLLEKLLHAHSEICVASQPFPVLYFQAKNAFLKSRDLTRRYPLDHLFNETDYSNTDFCEFLAEYRFDCDSLGRLFDDLTQYERGLWTREVLTLRDRIRPGTFLEVSAQLLEELAGIFGKMTAKYRGGKEILVEEFLPFLLSNGYRALLIIRDPRDMIASLDFRERDNLTGDHRPLLYSLRVWRKSVAFAIALQSHSGFYWLRYEDLVATPAAKLGEIATHLEVGDFPETLLHEHLRGQDGTVWSGNSSFTDHKSISRQSVGRFHELLPAAVLRYIECVCDPEMEWLGYDRVTDSARDGECLHSFREPFGKVHEKFPADYSSDPERIRSEIQRLESLRNSAQLLTSEQAAQWFISPDAYHCLSVGEPLGG